MFIIYFLILNLFSTSNGAAIKENPDVLRKFADYGVDFNGFSIVDCKINYPVLAETLQSAEKKGLNPCDDFYEFVCSGVKATIDAAISNKKDPGIGTVHLDNEDSQLKFTHNRLIVEQIENFWLAYLTDEKLRKEFPNDKVTPKMFTFFDKCVESIDADEVQQILPTLVNQFGMKHLVDQTVPIPMFEFTTEWMLQTISFNPFKLIRNARKSDDGTYDYRISIFYVMSKDDLKDYKDWFVGSNFTFPSRMRRPMNDSEMQQHQAKMEEIALDFAPIKDIPLADDVVMKVTLKELQEKYNLNGKLNWSSLMKKLFPEIKENSAFVMNSLTFQKTIELLGKYSNSKSQLEKEAFSEFLQWNLIYMSRLVSFGMSTKLECVRRLYTYFPHPMGRLLLNKLNVGGNDQNATAFEVFKYVRSGFDKVLEQSEWHRDAKHRDYAIQKLDHFLETIGLESEIGNDGAIVNSVYDGYKFDAQMNFYQMMVVAKRQWDMHFPFRNLYYTDMCENNGFYNQIWIGLVNRLLPVFNADFPAEYNFGYFGETLGHELAHSLQLDTKDYDTIESVVPGNGKQFWDKNYTDAYQQRTKCFGEQYKAEFGKLYPNQTFLPTLDEDLADNIGLHAGYEGWQLFNANKKRKRDQNPAGFAPPLNKYTPSQIRIAFPDVMIQEKRRPVQMGSIPVQKCA